MSQTVNSKMNISHVVHPPIALWNMKAKQKNLITKYSVQHTIGGDVS